MANCCSAKLIVGVSLESIALTKATHRESSSISEDGKTFRMEYSQTNVVVMNGRDYSWMGFLDALKMDRQDADPDYFPPPARDGILPDCYCDDEEDVGYTIHRTKNDGVWLDGYLGYCLGEGFPAIQVDINQAELFITETANRLKEAGITKRPQLFAVAFDQR